jgi:hypothetical protein
LVEASAALAGTWTPVSQLAPDEIQTMLLLSDGTVMAAGSADITNTWYRLTPDSQGSYVNGAWSTMAPMHDTRLYYSSDVLTNGNVFVAGAEYGTGTNSAEVYDPVRDLWTRCPPAPAGQTYFYDSISKILPSGNVLIAPVGPATSGGTVIYVTASNTWANGGRLFRGSYQDEASWVKLPDDSILTIDPFGVNSERYIPSLNAWVNDANVPVSLYDPFGSELGAAFLLPNGKAFVLGATGNTALYTPSGSTSPGVWAAGPVIPNSQATPDAPAAMLVNGNILCAVSPLPTSGSHFPSPTSFYEYNPFANSFTRVSGPTGLTFPGPSYLLRMLDLPDGNVLLATSDNQLYVYQPDGSPLAAGKPAISNIVQNVDGSFHTTGTLLNGISEGAAYGDDAQMESNYPLIRMTNSSSGVVYYARTYGWNSTSVMTSNRLVSTEFAVPVGLPSADYQLVMIANGNSSDSVLFSTTALPPIIVSQPHNQTVVVSNSATFQIGAAGTPLTYAWRQNGALISGATDSTYTWTNAQLSDSGDFFSCIVSNVNGSVTGSNAFLTVIPGVPPMITVQPVSVTAPVGGPASFSVTATSSVPVSYSWQRNGNVISGATSSTYATNNVQLADSGAQFRCLVTSIYGADLSSNATLTVVIGPSNDLCSGAFVIGSNNYTNSQSTALATTAGDLLPTCINGFGKGVWYVFTAVADGTAIADTIGSSFDTGLGVYSGACGSLTQLACNDDGGGNLTSRTTNSIFAGTSYYYLCGGYSAASGNLVFHFHFTGAPLPPNIVVQPANQTVPPNGSATFTITATGAAPLSYYWNRDGSPIAGATASSYTTNNVQFLDSGSQFTCLVSNAYGNVLSSPAILSVVDSALQNGGFETGDFTFWSTSGNFQDSYVTSGSPYVHSGTFGAELGPIGSLGYLSQSVATMPGNLYVISCWLYCDGSIPNEFSVAWNGTTLFDQVDMPYFNWNNIQLLVTAPASSPQLQFGFQNDGSWFGLDDIVVVPFAPPALQSVSQSNNTLSLTWSSVAGLTYDVQYTTDLSQPNWTSLAGLITASGNATSVTDFIVAPQRFYRVVLSLQGPAHK